MKHRRALSTDPAGLSDADQPSAASVPRHPLLVLLAAGVMLAGGAEALRAPGQGRQTSGEGPPSSVVRLTQDYMRKTGTPGVAIVFYDNGAEHEYNFGAARSDRAGPPRADTVFGIGSVTKVFTATLLAGQVLAQPGKFSLDDPVVKHLPWLRGRKLNDIRKVTLKMLATHTSGFPNQGPNGETLFQERSPSAELIRWWTNWKLPPGQPPIGTTYAYSNVGMITLGYAVAGVSYDTLLKSAITGPLGMNSTAAEAFLPRNAPLAQGHVDRKGKTVAIDTLNTDLNSTPADMLRFVKAQVGVLAGGTPLGRAIALTHEVQFPSATRKIDLGLAWEIHHSTPPLFTKNGATSRGGCSCWIAVAPATKQGMMVFTNKFGSGKTYGVGVTSFGHALLEALTGTRSRDDPGRRP